MPRAREELRRGLRSLIEVTSREMDALAGAPSAAPDAAEGQYRHGGVRQLRDPVPVPGIPPDASGVHPRKGVCAAYFRNNACWEVPEAFCNQALHICMLRECPVYDLNREALEKRFAAKFAHLW
jgi:hypothetical protein